MKFLSATGLARLVDNIRANLKVTETPYSYTTSSVETVTFTVPAYTTDGKSTLDIYINGVKVIPTVDYTLSGNVVTLKKTLNAGQTVLFIVRTISI